MKNTVDNQRDTSSLVARALGPLDATMIVIGSMIGSGIFITSAESARLIGAPGWLLLAWTVAGLMTITGALCCSELATMMPRAGGVYVFLRDALRPGIRISFWLDVVSCRANRHDCGGRDRLRKISRRFCHRLHPITTWSRPSRSAAVMPLVFRPNN